MKLDDVIAAAGGPKIFAALLCLAALGGVAVTVTGLVLTVRYGE